MTAPSGPGLGEPVAWALYGPNGRLYVTTPTSSGLSPSMIADGWRETPLYPEAAVRDAIAAAEQRGRDEERAAAEDYQAAWRTASGNCDRFRDVVCEVLADWVRCIGEDVGPAPGDPIPTAMNRLRFLARVIDEENA